MFEVLNTSQMPKNSQEKWLQVNTSKIAWIGRSCHPGVFLRKVFWKHAANLQENTHAEVRFQ